MTGIELSKTQNLPKVTCELCVRSLQHFSALKELLIENQFNLLKNASQGTNHVNDQDPFEKDLIDQPEIEYRNYSDSDEASEPPTKMIKTERMSPENELVWLPNYPSASDLLDEILPIAPDQECMFCQDKLPNTNALKQHIKIFHADQDVCNQSIRCPFKNCLSSFRKLSSLNEHKKLHEQEGSISCEICGKIFISKDQLRAHKKYHQEPKYKCNECDEAFFEAILLRNHVASRHGAARKTFNCTMCDKSYTKGSHLSRHVKVTHQKQTINCNVPNCNRVYTRRERVMTHITKQHPELSSDWIETYVNTIKTTPYTYGVPDEAFNDETNEENSNSDLITIE